MGAQGSRLINTPLPFFATVMGTGGLSLAWRRCAEVLHTPEFIAEALFWVALAVFIVTSLGYAVRISDPARLRADLQRPITVTFLTTITVSIVILSAASRGALPDGLAQAMWWLGAIGHLVAMVVTMRLWMNPRITLSHVTPAWFIPVVGNVIVPLGGCGFGSIERTVSLGFFAIGVVMWLGLLPVVLFRLFLAEPMPAPLSPTALVLLAPPAVSSVSAHLLFDGGAAPGVLATMLMASAGAFLLLALTMAPEIVSAPFGLAHWAMSFPLAAMASATLVFSSVVGLIFLAFATIVICALWARTVVAIAKGALFAPALP
ncbi:SLAC1 anion channel family protein [Corynebacterium sp. TAE3-ERU12]|uniref:SLAC1 anion channel family protein n=1 Tax=Corynebacterium sp. TAE3-ERU12 TaxID=2849491 RepID=UPI001C469A74|nr:SLAC1 anion channel family protein [Corynebacterium sp. TAE3-ERU12]MBV7295171.1 SLAC1 anion channel family protein [Corynebacterium sp. TAE3-ERU12]